MQQLNYSREFFVVLNKKPRPTFGVLSMHVLEGDVEAFCLFVNST
jgi:hypothetical protein